MFKSKKKRSAPPTPNQISAQTSSEDDQDEALQFAVALSLSEAEFNNQTSHSVEEETQIVDAIANSIKEEEEAKRKEETEKKTARVPKNDILMDFSAGPLPTKTILALPTVPFNTEGTVGPSSSSVSVAKSGGNPFEDKTGESSVPPFPPARSAELSREVKVPPLPPPTWAQQQQQLAIGGESSPRRTSPHPQRHVTNHFGSSTALSGFDLDVKKSEVYMGRLALTTKMGGKGIPDLPEFV